MRAGHPKGFRVSSELGKVMPGDDNELHLLPDMGFITYQHHFGVQGSQVDWWTRLVHRFTMFVEDG